MTQAAVSISPVKKTVAVGKTVKIKLKGGKATSWKTSAPGTAAIVEATQTYAKVKGLSAGKVTVTAKVGKKSYKCAVTVTGEDAGAKKVRSLTEQVKDLTGQVKELTEQIEDLKKQLAEAKKDTPGGSADSSPYIPAVIRDDEYVTVSFLNFKSNPNCIRFTVQNKHAERSLYITVGNTSVDGRAYSVSVMYTIPPNSVMTVQCRLGGAEDEEAIDGSVLSGIMEYRIYNEAGDKYEVHESFDYHDVRIRTVS